MTDDNKFQAEIVELANCRWAHLLKNYPRIRDAYRQHYDWPELDPLRHEISICIAFGLNQAAIALTNHFLESLLKYALMCHHSQQKMVKECKCEGRGIKAVVESWKDGKNLFGDKNLDFTINQACSVGLITKDEKKILHEYREVFRNAYAHADKEKTFGDFQTPVLGLRLEESTIVEDSEAEVRLADFLVAQGLFQVTFAEKTATSYFLSIDKLARQIILNLFPKRDSV